MQSCIGCFRYDTVHSTSWRTCKPENVLLNLVTMKVSDDVEDFFLFESIETGSVTQPISSSMGNWWGRSFFWAKRPWREATTHSHRLPRWSKSQVVTQVSCITSWPLQRKIYFCLPSFDVPVNQLTLHGVMLTFICLEHTELCPNIYRISETSGIWGEIFISWNLFSLLSEYPILDFWWLLYQNLPNKYL